MKVTLPQLHELKLAGTPIVMVTAYDHPSGRLVDQAGVDMVLVGDSAANTVLGHDAVSTVGATMEELLILTRAVARACEHALVIGDLPFMSYQVSDEDAVRNGGRFIKEAGADAVKLEGGGQSVQRAAALSRPAFRSWATSASRRKPPRCSAATRPRGASGSTRRRCMTRRWRSRRRGALRSCSSACPSRSPRPSRAGLRSSRSGSAQGPPPTARCSCCTTCSTSAPTHDFQPRFVKQFAHVGAAIREGVAAYATEVRSRAYPAPEHTYAIDPEQVSAFETAVAAGAGDDNVLADW